MRLHHLDEIDNDLLIKGLEPRGTKQVPRVHHQVNEREPHERSGGDVAFWTRNGLLGRCRGERLRLVSGRLSYQGEWIVPELITCDHVPSLIASNTCQQQQDPPAARDR